MLQCHTGGITTSRYTVKRKTELPSNVLSLDKGAMTLGQRIEERRKALGISQAELARRVGVRQSTMNSLINGDARSSRSIVQIARELQTTPAYLTGEIRDPSEDAPPPPPPPVTHLMMQVAFPSEAALAEMFRAILSVSENMTQDELALELARMLPKGLEIAQRVRPTYHQAFADDDAGPPDSADDGGQPRRRASGR